MLNCTFKSCNSVLLVGTMAVLDMTSSFFVIHILTMWKGVTSQCTDPMLFKLTDIQDQIAALNTEVAELKEKLAKHEEDVSFSAVLSGTGVTMTTSPTVFSIVKQNNGNAYDSNTGKLSFFVYDSMTEAFYKDQ